MKKVMDMLESNAAPIEFIDVEETNRSMIAMFPVDLERTIEEGNTSRYTHCEIHPSLMFSVYTATIPLANHNHAPRNIFSGAQGKQAIGLYATNFNNRIDTMSYILHYPQQRLVQTRYSNLLKTSNLPNGENLIVAIATFQGYNQEDSIIFNKDSVDRGMFNITSYKSYTSAEGMNKETGGQILFRNPDALKKQGKEIEITKYADYTKIDENGFPIVNSYIKEGDVIMGKVKIEEESQTNKSTGARAATLSKIDQLLKNQIDETSEYTSAVEIADKTVGGKVDKVYVKQNYMTGLREVKVRLRKFKTPELGDKAASTHGQKGVCGLLIPSSDMPFTKDGIVPDIIINPHAIPSRMTVGHLLECVLAKVAVNDGMFVDATAFDSTNMDYFYERLEDNGLERYGNEILYDGMSVGHLLESVLAKVAVNDGVFVDATAFDSTNMDYFYGRLEDNGLERYGNEILYDGMSGRQMSTDIFIGPTHYHRLKHMVSDKINHRGTGKKTGLTMQPTKGRSNQGGQRTGEMEVNAIISHGMAGFMKESFMERSDKAQFFVGHERGDILGLNPNEGKYFGEKEFSAVNMPFSLKLLTQELNGMCVNPGLKMHERGHPLNPDIDDEENENPDNDFSEYDEDSDDF